MINVLLRLFARVLLWLRYRVRVVGLDAVRRRGRSGILFLPNHPALIDPVIVLSVLHKWFAPRSLADQDQTDRFFIRWAARRMGARIIPSPVKHGAAARPVVERALAESIEGLRHGENLLLYPSGHAYYQRLEDLRGNSAVHTILQAVPDVRVVLVRIRGLWGSSFSRASGREPHVARILKKGILRLLANGIVFAPRRAVDVELVEPDDLPRTASRNAINACLEAFYNADAPPNTYVPYTLWERGGARPRPEPARPEMAGDVRTVPPATRDIVVGHLAELTGRPGVRDDQHLAQDLGLDSLARAELLVWLEAEFGFPQGDSDALQTVGDALLAACGETVSTAHGDLQPIPAAWFARGAATDRLAAPAAATVTEAFLEQARRAPGRIVVADQLRGAKSYRDLVTAILVLKPRIAALEGERVGIMLPASVAADTVYLATLFAGKTPVMVNWTVGPRNMVHSLDLVGVRRVLTAQALLDRLAAQGADLSALAGRFVPLEQLAGRISLFAKLAALAKSRLSWASLRNARVSDTAAILFTSGSEALPKAVPLAHANLAANLGAVLQVVALRADDRLLGMLPPFHALGLTGNILPALCGGLRTVYHANPTEAGALARLIEAYRATVLIGTPTFLGGIVRASTAEQLASLRLVVTGAEKCPARVYAALAERCPRAVVLEGYGVTECSPIISLNDEAEPRPGTIGKVLPSYEHVVLGIETGRPVGVGEPGVLLVRGPSVFDGYLHHDGRPPFQSFDGRPWYRTGDIVSRDADGVLTFRGRLKRFVKLGGEMVSLPAVEAVLARHYAAEPDGDDAPALAVEAAHAGGRPELVLFTTRPLDRADVNRVLRDAGLSPLHNVRRVVHLDELPLLGTGKTNYRALKAMLAQGEEPEP